MSVCPCVLGSRGTDGLSFAIESIDRVRSRRQVDEAGFVVEGCDAGECVTGEALDHPDCEVRSARGSGVTTSRERKREKERERERKREKENREWMKRRLVVNPPTPHRALRATTPAPG